MTEGCEENSKIHLNIILPSSPRSPKCGYLPSSFATKNSYAFLISPTSAACLSYLVFLDMAILKLRRIYFRNSAYQVKIHAPIIYDQI
jgi:hypothetical protein